MRIEPGQRSVPNFNPPDGDVLGGGSGGARDVEEHLGPCGDPLLRCWAGAIEGEVELAPVLVVIPFPWGIEELQSTVFFKGTPK